MKLLLYILLAMLGGQSIAQFGKQVIITTEARIPRYVTTADIDNDGDLDVVAASDGNAVTSWYRNEDGKGNFGTLQVISTNVDDVRFVATADLDGDGDEDVLTTCFGDDIVLWNRNENGTGNFGFNQIIADDAVGATVNAAGDLDGDGDMDVVSANRNENTVAWYENLDGMGDFGSEQAISTSITNARFVLVRDLDMDNDMDVLAVSTGLARVFWFENMDGAGAFSTPIEIPGVAAGSLSMDSKDIDGDGDFDVVVAASTQNRLYWNENTDGQGTFSGENVIDTRGSFVQSVFSEDLDADGDMDVVSITTDGEVAWYENTDGLGTFTTAKVISLDADNGRCVHAADLDGDGDNDVLSASITGDKVAWYENLTFLNVKENTLAATVVFPNPTGDRLIIETSAEIKEIKVLNALGQEMPIALEGKNKLSLAGLAQGIYTVRITGTNGGVFTENIVKH